MAAPAFLGQLYRNGGMNKASGALALVQSPRFLWASRLLAASGMVMDKLPITPKRTASPPLLGRALSGGLSGAALCSARRQSAFTGAVIGAAAATGAAWSVYHFRQQAVGKLHISSTTIALAEDAIVGGLGATLTYGLSTTPAPALKPSPARVFPHSPNTPA
jgi:uncharacterized membrane protein